MIDDWVGHYHRRPDNLLTRLPAEFKLGVALVLIVGTVLTPPTQLVWYFGVAVCLLVAVLLSGIPPLFLLKRLAWLSPLIFGVVLLNALQPAARQSWWAVAAKSTFC